VQVRRSRTGKISSSGGGGGNLFVDCQLLYEVITRYEHSE